MTQHVDFSEHDAAPSPKPPLYRLSALLEGHTDDVRALVGSASSDLFSSSRDGTARRWAREGAREGQTGGWKQLETYREGHEGFVNSVAWFTRAEKDYLATGGQDSTIVVYELPEGDTEASAESSPVQTLLGHMGNVCCLHATSKGDRIVSGSWDCTARVWDTSDWTCRYVLAEHGAAVWDVLAIETKGWNDVVITACADGLIRLWKGSKMKTLFKGHTEPARALAKVLPDDPDGQLFASASNDGSVRLWNFNGDPITVLSGHSSFIYSLIAIPTAAGGGLASSGEDGIIKVWNDEDGEEDQEILVPALSVWALTSLENGDLACGTSDNMIWVFTRDAARLADEATTAQYEEMLAKRIKPPSDPTPALPIVDASTLAKPGTKEGDLKLVAQAGITHAYQWSTASSSWTDLGEVVDNPSSAEPAPAAAKTTFEGEEYDLVFSIDVKDDEPPLKLPYNFGDDTRELAKRFVAKHELPTSYVEQIDEFVRVNAAQ